MGSFRKRLLVLIIGLVVVTQTVTLAAVLASTSHTVEARAAEQLRAGGSFVEQLIRFRAGQLANGVGILAADFGFREAVASGDVPTILSAASNNAKRIGADMTLLLDTHGKVLASTMSDKFNTAPSLDRLLEDSRGPRDEPTFMVWGQRSYQLFLAPVRTPEIIAWVAMGFAVDDSLARKIRDLAGVQVTLVARSRAGLAQVASTLPDADRKVLSTTSASLSSGGGEPRVVRFGDTEYLSFAQRLEARGDPIDVVLQKPMREVLAPYRDVRDALLLIDGVAVVLATVLGAFLGRSTTRPIRELMSAAKRIQEGRYETSVEISGGEEFRSLAGTFNAMQRTIAEREADITHRAYHDSVTGLPNRTLARRRVQELVASTGSPNPSSLILLHIRNLREINASLGHDLGDEVLREVARRLRQNAARDDLVARVGESQFLVIVPSCSAQRARLCADQLGGVIRAGFHVTAMSLDLDVAAGICVYPDHGRNADELLRRVQVALEDSDNTRTDVTVYREGRDEEHRRKLALVTDLRAAIDGNALTLVYQPKVTMATRSVKSLEALVRWTHPQLGPISPSEFVPLAESTGGSRALTGWVLNTAIRQMGEWRREGLDVELAVNLSAPDILEPHLGGEIMRLLRMHRVEPSSLLLEITESAAMLDPQLAARHMQLLRVAGVRFAIDDFGTGHSSLSQLSVLPVDELKIDRSFISPRGRGNSMQTIVTSTIDLGHSMGLTVVAEGVEEPEAWNLLRRLGCDFAQGYLISPPLPAREVPPFVRKANQLLPASDSTVLQIQALHQLSGPTRR